MQITKNTPLYLISELMGSIATKADAQIMLDELLSDGVTDTDELSESEWLAAMDRAFAGRP